MKPYNQDIIKKETEPRKHKIHASDSDTNTIKNWEEQHTT